MEFLQKAQKEHEIAKSMVRNHLAANVTDAMKKVDSPAPHQTVQQPSAFQHADSQKTDDGQKRLEKIEGFLSRFDKFFSKFYEDSNSQLAALSKEVVAMKEEISRIKSQGYGTRAASQPPAQANNAAARQQPENKHSPRTGDFKPGDVAIENIFSNAHGKMMKR
jgi:hypothetical protein